MLERSQIFISWQELLHEALRINDILKITSARKVFQGRMVQVRRMSQSSFICFLIFLEAYNWVGNMIADCFSVTLNSHARSLQ